MHYNRRNLLRETHVISVPGPGFSLLSPLLSGGAPAFELQSVSGGGREGGSEVGKGG